MRPQTSISQLVLTEPLNEFWVLLCPPEVMMPPELKPEPRALFPPPLCERVPENVPPMVGKKPARA